MGSGAHLTHPSRDTNDHVRRCVTLTPTVTAVTVMHEGISNASRVFESSISNVLVNHVYKRTFHGQSGDFFMSSINVVASTGKLLGPKFIGQVKIGVSLISIAW